jgi:uncharacterized protein YbjT (DUF2867 family)
MMHDTTILVTGATGYVGGRLIPRLLNSGHRVRALGRSVEKMAARPWACDPRVELVQGDVLDRGALVRAAKGCTAAYYLVHSMIARKKAYAEADRLSAYNMKAAAETAGLKQIIYLGGLGDHRHPNLSRHLASRHEVGRILQSGTVPATVLRAAMILGSGSASFEILRYLVDRLPIMITPKWVHTPTQPIAITNVLDYLAGCLDNEQTYGRTFDIGGPEVVTYQDLIDIYARKARLPSRILLPVPVLSPTLSAYWIHLVTPVPGAIALPLTEGLRLPTICTDHRIRSIVPVDLISCETAIADALDQLLEKQVDTCWSDAGALQPPEWAACGDAGYAGGTILGCAFAMDIQAPPEAVWRPVVSLGGGNGYYFGDRLWNLRGILDRLVGGVGLRRGRRHPSRLQVGDALDFWRVLHLSPNRRLTLMAEMKVPGEALLDIQLAGRKGGTTELRMISRFLPRGLGGLAYWYALLPFHVMIFKGMLRSMARHVGASAIRGPRRIAAQPDPTPVCTAPPRNGPS